MCSHHLPCSNVDVRRGATKSPRLSRWIGSVNATPRAYRSLLSLDNDLVDRSMVLDAGGSGKMMIGGGLHRGWRGGGLVVVLLPLVLFLHLPSHFTGGLTQAFLLPWSHTMPQHHHPLPSSYTSPTPTTTPSSWSSSSLASMGGGGPPSPPQIKLTPEMEQQYEGLLQSLLQPGEEGLEAAVEKNLDGFDYFFMGWVAQKASKASETVRRGQ